MQLQTAKLIPFSERISCVAVSPDSKILACASGEVHLLDTISGEVRAVFSGHDRAVWLAFFRNGELLASTDFSSIRLWDVANGKQLAEIQAHSSWVYCVAVSPDEKTMVSTGNDGRVRLWDVAAGKELKSRSLPRNFSESVSFSPDGENIALACGSMIKKWNAHTLDEQLVLKRHRMTIKSVAFSPDGQMVASGSYDATVKIWNVRTGTEVRTFKGHGSRVWCVAFSPDGLVVASAGWDGTVRVWDVGSGAEQASLPVQGKCVDAVAFSSNGQWLTAGGNGNVLQVWKIEE